MNNQWMRTALLAMLFLGCIVLAVPQWSQKLEAILFGSGSPIAETTSGPRRIREESLPKRPEQLAIYTSSVDGSTTPPRSIQLGYEEPIPANHSASHPRPDFQSPPRSLEQPTQPANADLLHRQQTLEQLGAKYVVVEIIEDRYQCRCLMPLSPDSVYDKAFAAEDHDPARAMQAVIEQVKIWQTHNAGGWEEIKSRELRK